MPGFRDRVALMRSKIHLYVVHPFDRCTWSEQDRTQYVMELSSRLQSLPYRAEAHNFAFSGGDVISGAVSIESIAERFVQKALKGDFRPSLGSSIVKRAILDKVNSIPGVLDNIELHFIPMESRHAESSVSVSSYRHILETLHDKLFPQLDASPTQLDLLATELCEIDRRFSHVQSRTYSGPKRQTTCVNTAQRPSSGNAPYNARHRPPSPSKQTYDPSSAQTDIDVVVKNWPSPSDSVSVVPTLTTRAAVPCTLPATPRIVNEVLFEASEGHSGPTETTVKSCHNEDGDRMSWEMPLPPSLALVTPCSALHWTQPGGCNANSLCITDRMNTDSVDACSASMSDSEVVQYWHGKMNRVKADLESGQLSQLSKIGWAGPLLARLEDPWPNYRIAICVYNAAYRLRKGSYAKALHYLEMLDSSTVDGLSNQEKCFVRRWMATAQIYQGECRNAQEELQKLVKGPCMEEYAVSIFIDIADANLLIENNREALSAIGKAREIFNKLPPNLLPTAEEANTPIPSGYWEMSSANYLDEGRTTPRNCIRLDRYALLHARLALVESKIYHMAGLNTHAWLSCQKAWTLAVQALAKGHVDSLGFASHYATHLALNSKFSEAHEVCDGAVDHSTATTLRQNLEPDIQ
ncbi:hypothetical protein F5Y17DRAFT_460238 [Xylariaceae sp. FL0594]|nr:hypothetical protein F5Y17DRAFT_460238 [Xylariaceae sp. FL0594]